MRKRKKKLPPIRETEAFKELVKELRKQTPVSKVRLIGILDEIIDEKTDMTEEKEKNHPGANLKDFQMENNTLPPRS